MEVTFELELLAREFQHKYAILGADIAMQYKATQTTGAVKLPEFIVEQQSLKHVSDTIHEYKEKGTFDAEYEKAWEKIKDRIPDNYSTLL